MSKAVFNWVRKGLLRKFLWLGVIMWVAGIAIFALEFGKYGQWAQVQGEIAHLKTYTKYDQTAKKTKAVYDFGVAYEYEGFKGVAEKFAFSGTPKFAIGDPYPIRVNPDNPRETRVTAGFEMALIVTFCFGGLFLLISAAAFFTDPARKARLAQAQVSAHETSIQNNRKGPAPRKKGVR